MQHLLLQASALKQQQHLQLQQQQQRVVVVPQLSSSSSPAVWGSRPLLVQQPQQSLGDLSSPLFSLLQQQQLQLQAQSSLLSSSSLLPQQQPPPSDCLTILQHIGSQCRAGPFVDVLALPGFAQAAFQLDEATEAPTFPYKLFQMVSNCTDESVCRFVARGRAFLVVDKDRFVQEVLPRYCRQTKWGSFQRQLHNYGFERIANGPHRGAFYHELFVQGQPGLMTFVKRVGAVTKDGRARTTRPTPNFGQLMTAEKK